MVIGSVSLENYYTYNIWLVTIRGTFVSVKYWQYCTTIHPFIFFPFPLLEEGETFELKEIVKLWVQRLYFSNLSIPQT